MGIFTKEKKSVAEKALGKLLAGASPPTFPSLTLRVLREIRDPDATAEHIAEAIQWDPGLVVRILRTVNSTAYGPATPIQGLHHAVAYMGRAEIEQVVLALAVKSALPSTKAPGFEPGRFWTAAARRAALARRMADRLHPSTAGECFTAALLQDMGVPILAHARPADYGAVLQAWHGGEPRRLDELERAALGFTHADVGGILGRVWELPQVLAQAIFHHHRGSEGRELQPALRLVALLRETRVERDDEEFLEAGRSDFGLPPDWTREALQDSEKQAAELAALLR